MSMNAAVPDETIWCHLRDLPYFRAMLRAVEDSFYQRLELPAPVLDVGCGDAHFASAAFSRPLEVGVDSWFTPLKEAHRLRAYCFVAQADGGRMPFPGHTFASVISNSVLEHIPDVENVLQDIARVLQPGGVFVFSVPNHRFPQLLWGTQVFRQLGVKAAADCYSRLFNRVSRHVHCDSPEVWQDRLYKTGVTLEKTWDYFPAPALHVFEMGHFLGLPSLVSRMLTSRWILAKNHFNLALTYRLIRPHMMHPISSEGAYSFYITRRTAL